MVQLSQPTTPKDVEVFRGFGPSSVQRLQDWGDAASSWLEAVTDIAGCRLTGMVVLVPN